MLKLIIISNFRSKKSRLHKAIESIEDNYHEFLNELEQRPLFPKSNITGKGLSNIFQERIWAFKVKKYWNPFSSALAYTKPSRPGCIYLNSAKLRRTSASIAGTLVHEAVHLMDFEKESFEFGHGRKWNRNRKFTAPYWCGYMMEKIINQS